MKILTFSIQMHDGSPVTRGNIEDALDACDLSKSGGSGDNGMASFAFTLTDAPVADADCGPRFIVEVPQ